MKFPPLMVAIENRSSARMSNASLVYEKKSAKEDGAAERKKGVSKVQPG